MVNGDVDTARLMLAVMDDTAWKDDMARLAGGFIARQQNGAWHTTANLWGGLALDKISTKFEAALVVGLTTASVEWRKVERVKAGDTHPGNFFVAPSARGELRNNTMFLPWGSRAKNTLTVAHQGAGKPWLMLQLLATPGHG